MLLFLFWNSGNKIIKIIIDNDRLGIYSGNEGYKYPKTESQIPQIDLSSYLTVESDSDDYYYITEVDGTYVYIIAILMTSYWYVDGTWYIKGIISYINDVCFYSWYNNGVITPKLNKTRFPMKFRPHNISFQFSVLGHSWLSFIYFCIAALSETLLIYSSTNKAACKIWIIAWFSLCLPIRKK